MSDPLNDPLFSALTGGAFDSADLAKRVDEIERRVEQLEARTAQDPRIGRRCLVMTWRTPALHATVVHVDWDGTLLVRGEDSDPSWQPMRFRPDDVEWLIEPLLESR